MCTEVSLKVFFTFVVVVVVVLISFVELNSKSVLPIIRLLLFSGLPFACQNPFTGEDG